MRRSFLSPSVVIRFDVVPNIAGEVDVYLDVNLAPRALQ
jgi:hypothetical protein